MIEPFYKCYDQEEKGFLTISESKKFFAFVMDLNYKLKDDRESFKSIMKYIDKHNQQRAEKENILQFFYIDDFLRIANKKKKKHAYANVGQSAMSNSDSSSDEKEDLLIQRSASYYDMNR